MELSNNFVRYIASLIYSVLQIVGDVGLLGDTLAFW